MTQWAPHGTGLACKKVRIVSQPTIEEEPEEEATGEAMATGEVEAAGEPAVEVVVDEDATMQDAPEAAPMAEVGPLADATRMSPMDAVDALTVHRYHPRVPPDEPGGDRLADASRDVQVA